ncbi:MAG: M1 family metallopeptidase [Myxococcota bacterium]|nr:M1 family metallopeptidase [Myxococcota bacterium]
MTRLTRTVLSVGLAFGFACNETPTAEDLKAAKVQTTASKKTTKQQKTAQINQSADAKTQANDTVTASLRRDAQNYGRNVDIEYEIDVKIDFDFFTFEGQQNVKFKNRAGTPLNELYFFLYPNTKELTGGSGRNIVVSNVRVAGASVAVEGTHTPLLKINLDRPLQPDEVCHVELDFKGILYRQQPNASDMKKLAMEQLLQLVTGRTGHSGGYGVFSVGEGIVSMALWHPVLAAHDERGWDVDPGTDIGDRSYFDVANYSVTVDVPKQIRMATTGVQQLNKTRGTKRHFVAAAVREFAMQLSENYESASTDVAGVRVNSWFLKKNRDVGLSVLKQAADALRVFERDFGPYPYRELDVAQSPLTGGAGGVEFPGLVTVAHMFYSDQIGGLSTGSGSMGKANQFLADTREFVVAHEVAHQWWNAIVGSDSKRHPFVDEALANHSAIHYFQAIHGKRAAEKQRDLQLRLPWQMSRMSGGQDRPVDLPTREFNNMVEYAAVVYAKGGLFFDAVRQELGEQAFLGVIQTYYRDYTFKIAKPDDLERRLVGAARNPDRMRQLIDRWLRGRHADKDIASVSYITLLEQFVGRDVLRAIDPKLETVLNHRGFEELVKLLKSVTSSDGTLKEGIDYQAVIALTAELLGTGENELNRLLGLTTRLLLDNGSIKPGQIVRELGGVIAGEDKEVGDLINAFGGVIDAIDQLNKTP